MYAEALATATEFSRSIVRQSTDLLAQAGVPSPGRYLSALIHSTVDHALSEAGSAGTSRTRRRLTSSPESVHGAKPDCAPADGCPRPSLRFLCLRQPVALGECPHDRGGSASRANLTGSFSTCPRVSGVFAHGPLRGRLSRPLNGVVVFLPICGRTDRLALLGRR